jgi:hypothetical protein
VTLFNKAPGFKFGEMRIDSDNSSNDEEGSNNINEKEGQSVKLL